MDYAALLVPMGIAILKLFIGLVLALLTAFCSVKFFDTLTRNIEEWQELKKGNTAVGILLGAVVLSTMMITAPGIVLFVVMLDSVILAGSWIMLLVGLLAFAVTFIIALGSVYLCVRLLDAMTADVDKMAALKKGNIAVAIYLAAVILAVSAVMLLLELITIPSAFILLSSGLVPVVD